MNSFFEEDPRDEPNAVPIDPEAERLELEAAGWERIVTEAGKVLWRHPVSRYLYPQGPAMNRLRRDLNAEKGSEKPGDSGA